MLEKILSIVSIGGFLSSLNLTRKFVAHVTIIIALAVAGAVIGAALAVFSFYEAFSLLLYYGAGPALAAVVVILMGVLILLIILACIARKLRALEAIPLTYAQAGAAGSSALAAIKGFCRGLVDKNPF